MKRRITLNQSQRVDIINAYQQNLEPMATIASRYSVTRQTVYKVLKQAGVDTSTTQVPVSCTVCGKTIYRTKSRIRKQLHHFCNEQCYHAWLRAGSQYVQNRHGQRIARTIVSDHFALQPGHVVHHENKNNLDNRLTNLRVFATQGDHIRYHRGFDVTPIWDGRYV
jgi:hypothetical protein